MARGAISKTKTPYGDAAIVNKIRRHYYTKHIKLGKGESAYLASIHGPSVHNTGEG